MKKEILFGVPVIQTSIDPSLYDKTKIIKTIHQNYKLDPNRNEWTGGDGSHMHHSYNDWDNPKFKQPNFDKLISVYRDVFKEAINSYKLLGEVSISAAIKNYTCMKKTQSMQQHNHLTPVNKTNMNDQADFTSIDYIKFNPKKHLPTSYKNSQAWAKYYTYCCPKHSKFIDGTWPENSFMYDDYRLDTQEDDIIFVPSILEHYIPIQTSNETRITIVSNITIQKT